MPAILTQASIYPPREWNLVIKPSIFSKNQLWIEMTKDYELIMAGRHRQASTTIRDSITAANLPMLRPEAMERLEKEASIKRRTSFEEEADISYIYLNMDLYDDNRDRILKNRMQTIPEGQELQPKTHQTSTNAGIPIKDADKLPEIKQLFIIDDVEVPIGPHLHEAVQQYNLIATEKATIYDPYLACDHSQSHGDRDSKDPPCICDAFKLNLNNFALA